MFAKNSIPAYRWIVSVWVLSVLSACGGGGGEGGSVATVNPSDFVRLSSSRPAVANGFVTGIGALAVDGVAYTSNNLSAISIEHENIQAPVASTLDQLKLGQHVEINYSAGDVAAQLRVQSDLIGPVTQTVVFGAEIRVAGQRVVMNDSPTQGPITILEGVTQLAQLRLGDRIEVHGLFKADSAGGYIQASRIEFVSAVNSVGASNAVKVLGQVKSITPQGTNTVLKVGDLSVVLPQTAALSPVGAKVQVGDRVKVYAKQGLGVLQTPVGPQTLLTFTAPSMTADALSIRQQTPADTEVRYVGAVADLNTSNKSLSADGLAVDASAIANLPVTGQAVLVRGVRPAANAAVRLSELKVGDDIYARVTSKGPIPN